MRSRRPALAAAAVLIALPTLVSTPAPAEDGSPVYGVGIPSSAFTFSSGAGAAVGRWTLLSSRGAASTYVTTTEVVRMVVFAVEPQPCEGSPHLELAADGATVLSQEMLAASNYVGERGGRYSVPVRWQPGRHKLTFRFLDDHLTAGCDRNLWLTDIGVHGGLGDSARQTLPSSGVTVVPATAGEAGTPTRPWSGVAKLWNNGSLRFRLNSQGARELYIRLTGAVCGGATADVRVEVDGEVLHDGQLPPTGFVRDGVFHGYLLLRRVFVDGTHSLAVTMSQDLTTPVCGRNLVVEQLLFQPDISR